MVSESDKFNINEEIYELAFPGSSVGIWKYDLSVNRFYYSDNLKKILGYNPTEFEKSGYDFWRRIYPDDYKALRRAFDKHLKVEKKLNIDCRLQSKSGRYLWFALHGEAIRDDEGEAIGISGILLEITRYKRAEEKLKVSEKQFRNLIEQSPFPTELLNPNGQINYANPAWERMWNITSEEAAQILENYNMLTDQQLVDQGLMSLCEKAFAGEIVSLPPFQYDAKKTTREMGLTRIKPTSPWIQCYLYPLKDLKGNIKNVVNIYFDITKLKLAEVKLSRQREELVRYNRSHSLGQLAGSIAHELNQPLTGILSNSQAGQLLLLKNQPDKDELEDILNDIVNDTKRAGEIIHNLVKLYREHKLKVIPLDINSVITDTIRLLNSEFVVQHTEVTTELSSSLPIISGNRIQIQQVLVNLILNSLNAMRSISREKRLLSVTSDHDGDELIVLVEDNGTGINTKYLNKIFNPQVTYRSGGTGMGLAICKSIIEAHGGRIWAENRDKGGARFGFKLPVISKTEHRQS
jgi:PAS domain S-box-containing protein